MVCNGIDALAGAAVELRFGRTIESAVPAAGTADLYVAPGWIDLQVNGFGGVDYNSPRAPHDEIARSVHTLYATGTTRFYPTIITGGPEETLGALRNLAAFKESHAEGAAIEGFHMEGPHIAPDDGPRGAHLRRWVRPPDIEEFRRWQDAARGHIRLVTLSPEYPNAPAYIEKIVGSGVVASIGHTQATAEQIQEAVRAGATLSTHLGNGAHPVLRRHPNYIWEQLAEDRLMAGFIVDGIHLGAAYLKVALRAKGIERAILVTDASMPSGCRPGKYFLGEQEVDLTEDYRVVLAGTDRLAGSALRMDRGVENLMRLAGLSLADSVRMATVNAARGGGVPGRTAGLSAGDRADLVFFRFDPERRAIEVHSTWVDGNKVFEA